jgi:hypothetical protein
MSDPPRMTAGIKLSLMMPESRVRLEHFIEARNLRYPPAFPYHLAMPHAVVVEVLEVRAKPLRDSSASKLRLTAKLRVSVRALATRYIDDPGQERKLSPHSSPIEFDMDILIEAIATPNGDGLYEIQPETATLMTWWTGATPEQ